MDEFKEMISTIDLLPGRRILLSYLSSVIERLKQNGIGHLAALHTLLQNKEQYPELADNLSVSPEYLIVLNREISSYLSKPIPLSKLDLFTEAELERLEAAGLKSTKQLFESCVTRATRLKLAEELNIPENRMIVALEMAELLRINGVGPVFAKILIEMGIRSAAEYLHTESSEILSKYHRVIEDNEYTKAKLGIKDIEYCKRFCKRLHNEIEW
ncbi:MAG: DUF4332 domain-containing protein [Anaerolineae bacterium]